MLAEKLQSRLIVKHSDHHMVVVVHGLWLTGGAMTILRARFEQMGFQARSFSYPSVHEDLSHNAAQLFAFVQALRAERIHLVGHSMGGLLALQMLKEHHEPRIGRVVLAGSPYQDIQAVKNLMRNSFTQGVVGKSISQWLGQAKPDVASSYQIGVIAGDRSLGLGRLVSKLPKPNDGTIVVEETQVPGAKDSILLHVTHSQMLFSAQVAEQAARFLETGRFDHTHAQ
jgi:pimeloyl-ACP methyl ester carboxylesterase